MADLPIRGVFCAAATPLKSDLTPDLDPFVQHCRTLLHEGCDGVALLGTTGAAVPIQRIGKRIRRALGGCLRIETRTGCCCLA